MNFYQFFLHNTQKMVLFLKTRIFSFYLDVVSRRTLTYYDCSLFSVFSEDNIKGKLKRDI